MDSAQEIIPLLPTRKSSWQKIWLNLLKRIELQTRTMLSYEEKSFNLRQSSVIQREIIELLQQSYQKNHTISSQPDMLLGSESINKISMHEGPKATLFLKHLSHQSCIFDGKLVVDI